MVVEGLYLFAKPAGVYFKGSDDSEFFNNLILQLVNFFLGIAYKLLTFLVGVALGEREEVAVGEEAVAIVEGVFLLFCVHELFLK